MNDFEKIEQVADATLQTQPQDQEIPVARSSRGIFEVGTIIASQYKVLELIGTGGMSDVYRCEDMAVNRIIAVKTLLVGANDSAISRFQTEGKAIARLEHANIVKLYGLQIASDGMPILAMEYVGGTTLAELLEQQHPLPVQRVMRLAAQICNALSAAHKEGIIHRDLKPSNIMIVGAGSLDEKVKILDFGIAKIQGEESGIQATRTGEIFGTPQYMSPEQALGKRSDVRADQYSLGCVLFEMLSGQPPFTAESPLEIMMAHVKEQAPSLDKVANQSIPAHLVRAIAVLLAKDPDLRFATIDDATKAIFGETTAQKALPSRFLLLSMLGAVVALVAAGAIAFSVMSNHPRGAAGESVSAGTDGLNHQQPFLNEADSELAGKVREHPGMTELDLSEQHVTKAGVRIVGELHDLKKLNLCDCYEVAPEDIKDISFLPLTTLILQGTATTDESMPILRKISGLQELSLKNTEVTDQGIKSIAPLSLTTLNLEGTKIANGSLETLGQMSSLKDLNLQRTDITAGGCTFLQSLSNLDTLNVSHTAISTSDLKCVGRLKKLNTLYLDHDPKITNGIAFLKDAPIRFLELGWDHVTSDDVLALSQIRTLEILDLRETNISDRDLATLGRNPVLKKLYIQGCNNITQSGVDRFQEKSKGQCALWYDGVPIRASKSVAPLPSMLVGPNLLQNGSFESSSVPHYEPSTDCNQGETGIAHWTVTAGTVGLIGRKWAAAQGDYSLELNGTTPGAIEQSFKTRPGEHYIVTFMAAVHPGWPLGQPQNFTASAAGQSQKFVLCLDPAQSINGIYWKPYQWTFKATSAITKLRFTSNDAGGRGACIDSVAVFGAK